MAGDSEQIGADEIEKLLSQQQQQHKPSETAPSTVRAASHPALRIPATSLTPPHFGRKKSKHCCVKSKVFRPKSKQSPRARHRNDRLSQRLNGMARAQDCHRMTLSFSFNKRRRRWPPSRRRTPCRPA